MRTSKPLVRLWLLLLLAGNAGAQDFENDRFRQLEELLPTPSESRLASGAPGPAYWQQQVDYVIDVELLDEEQRIVGAETITYHNRSPHSLHYLWLQLDTNALEEHSAGSLSAIGPDFKEFSYGKLRRLVTLKEFDGSVRVDWRS